MITLSRPNSYLHSMYSKWRLAKKYLSYYLISTNGKGHGTHSPFIYHFIRHILNDNRIHPGYEQVERLRQKLLHDDTILVVDDLGAGSTSGNKTQRRISDIAKSAAKPKKYGQLLYRMVKAYQPQTILELGTSLGLTTSYLALANPSARVVTIEGSAVIAVKAKEHFSALGLTTIETIQGNFDDLLPAVTREAKTIDLAFIDGNHRQEPTERYFQQLLPALNNNSILVFDDIHWSRDMELAWQYIKVHPSVTCSIDLFFIGIIFFRKEFFEKQQYYIRF